MLYFFFRYIKLTFLLLRLHLVFNWCSIAFLHLYYLVKFSLWVSKNRKISYNDFPSIYNYEKRYEFFKWVMDHEGLSTDPINYMEFGVAQGTSFRWFLQLKSNPQSRFLGFDTFTGLPEDFGPYKKGSFSNLNAPPDVSDKRVKFYQGLFQQTMPGFLAEIETERKNVVMLDADLYSSTMYILTTLAPYFKKGDIIFFDEFSVARHEFKAYYEFVQSFYINLELIAAANNYHFVAFKVG